VKILSCCIGSAPRRSKKKMDTIVSFPRPIVADWLLTITEVRLADGDSILHVGEITYKDKPVIRITSAGSEATADLLSRFERWVDDHVEGDRSPVGEASTE